MSRINYGNEPIVPDFGVSATSERCPVLVTDGIPLARQNLCPDWGAGNREMAYICFNCGRPFRNPLRQNSDPDSLRYCVQSFSEVFLFELAFYAVLGLLIRSTSYFSGYSSSGQSSLPSSSYSDG